jgi:hypothetical protein
MLRPLNPNESRSRTEGSYTNNTNPQTNKPFLSRLPRYVHYSSDVMFVNTLYTSNAFAMKFYRGVPHALSSILYIDGMVVFGKIRT